MKHIYIAIALLLLVGVGGLILNKNKNSVATMDATISGETPTAELLAPSETDEYTIDPSDMYSVDEISVNEDTSLITENEERWLRMMREEEKLARDVYQTLGDIWGMRIFSNIASSEQTHTDAVKVLLERYNVQDPVTDDTVGVFSDPEIQKLYNDLTAQGAESLLAALIVGATIEDLDIHDLDQAIADTDTEDIIVVYQNLQKGSRNHLRAFVSQINQNGSTYTPQYISISDYENIISSPQERGRIN